MKEVVIGYNGQQIVVVVVICSTMKESQRTVTVILGL